MRLRLAQGARFLLKGEVWIVRRVLLDDRLLIESQSFGTSRTVCRGDLYSAWAAGDLSFETGGRNTGPASDDELSASYTTGDLGGLPSEFRGEAWRRYRLILPLLRRPPEERTRAAIGEYAASLRPSESRAVASLRTRSPVGEAASAGSIERWLRAFLRSGHDIRSLVPTTDRQGGKGSKRLPDEVERLIEGVLADCAARPGYRTSDDVYLMVVNRVADANAHRAPGDKLQPPGSATIFRRIREAGSASILRRARSRAEKRSDSPVSEGPRPTHALERVEIDHTLLDLLLVDADDQLPIGRPTLTLAIDVYSRMPFGFYVGFEPSSYLAVMGCLLHGILPKADVREMYGARNCWPVWGLPEKLVTDNGREFVGRDLEDACAQLGIILEPNPPRSPWYKGTIERFIRTDNTGLVHTLPGTTCSNLAGRGDYDPARHACVSLSSFNRLLHVWLLDVYAQDWHEGARGIPAKLWKESLASGWEPALHHSAEEVRILLCRTAERTLGRTGIDFESLRYQSPDLARLRSVLPAGTRVRVKYDSGDLGGVHVVDSTRGGGWLYVPALDQEYASGLSLWKHRALRRLVLAEKGEVAIHALAEAKERVRDIAREEIKSTRKVRGRKRAARMLDAGDGATPTTPSSARERGTRMPSHPTASTPGPAGAAASREGWGGDYGLPTRAERPS